jgi:hypothetical protein
MIPSTVERVPKHTAAHVNQWIAEQTKKRVARYADASPAAIERRLKELDQEWDIERTLEANAASACMAGVALGALVDRRFFFFPAVIGGFLLQHAIQGWCPPLIWFRRMGVRTQSEIDYERYALKALRGDFREVDGNGPRSAHLAMEAAVS